MMPLVLRMLSRLMTLKRMMSVARQTPRNNDSIHFYIGLLNLALFMWVVDIVRYKVKMCHAYISVEDHVLVVLWTWDKIKVCPARLSIEDHVLFVSMKLRLGLLEEDFAHRFGIELTIVPNVDRLWLLVLSKYMRVLIGWPDRNSIIRHMPVCFRRNI